MNRPGVFQGVLVAAGMAVLAGILVTALATSWGTVEAFRWVVAGVSLTYIGYLLSQSRVRTGRVTTVTASVLLSILLSATTPSLSLLVLGHIAAIWLVRSLYYYAGVFPALLDLGLTALSCAAFIWAVSRTGSIGIATWCFFLGQALFTWIPASIGRHAGQASRADNRSFDLARRQADGALRILIKD